MIAAAGSLLSVVAGGDGGRTVMAKKLNVNPKGIKTKGFGNCQYTQI